MIWVGLELAPSRKILPHLFGFHNEKRSIDIHESSFSRKCSGIPQSVDREPTIDGYCQRPILSLCLNC